MKTLLCCLCVLSLAAPMPASAQESDAGRAVTIEVTILEFKGVEKSAILRPMEEPGRALARIRQLEQEGKSSAVTRMRLATLENLPATVQHGETVAVPSGRTFGPSRMPLTSYSRENFGTMVTVTPRVEADRQILLELTVERTQLRQDAMPTRRAEEPDGDAEQVPPATDTLVAKTTLRVQDGETLVVHLMEGSAGEGAVLRAVLVTAHAAN